jgi:hypothetical protein
MWYQVDEDALDDVRIKRLARRLSVSHGDAFLAVNRIWRLVYRRAEAGESLVLHPEDIEAEGEIDDFTDHLLHVGLAEASLEGIRIKGDERAKKLADSNRKQADRRRSKKTADEPRCDRGATADEPRSTKCEPAYADATADEPRTNRGGTELRRSSPTEKTGSGSGALFPSEPPDPKSSGSSTTRARDPRPVFGPVPTGSAGSRAVTDRWEERYHERAGRKPTWHERHFANLSRLLKAHGQAAVIQAVDVLFDAPPRFLSDSLPDFDTLVKHFDKLAAPARATTRASPTGATTYSPTEMAEMARAEFERERAGGSR